MKIEAPAFASDPSDSPKQKKAIQPKQGEPRKRQRINSPAANIE